MSDKNPDKELSLDELKDVSGGNKSQTKAAFEELSIDSVDKREVVERIHLAVHPPNKEIG